jgi:uncharacterized membrane protein YoaK (UPF0700 family)
MSTMGTRAAEQESGQRTASALPGLLPRRLWRTPAGPGWGPLPELLLILTAVTGMVDAVSILALGRVFVANMTGNVVFAGFALVGAPGFSLAASLFALAGFLVGAWAGGALTIRVGHDRALHLRAAAGAEVTLLAISLAIAGVSGGAAAAHGTLHLAHGTAPFGAGITDALAAILAIALGLQNAVARKLALPDLTTTVLTMTLTGIGADSRSGHPGHVILTRRLLAVVTTLTGGVAGAWLVLHVGTVTPLAIATALLAITAGSAALAARRPGEWRQAKPATGR